MKKDVIKTVNGKYGIIVTKKYFVTIGLLFMMLMSSNFTFGQSLSPPNKDFSPNSKKAAVIVSNNDNSGGNGNEYIYLRSGEEDNEEWFYDAQFIVANDWVGTRRPLRFYTERNSWNGAGEYIMNTKNVDSNRGYGLSFYTGRKELMTLTRESVTIKGNINFTGDLFKNGNFVKMGDVIVGPYGDPLLNLVSDDHSGHRWGRIGAFGSLAFWANGYAGLSGTPVLEDGEDDPQLR